jgi:hypothetical protein
MEQSEKGTKKIKGRRPERKDDCLFCGLFFCFRPVRHQENQVDSLLYSGLSACVEGFRVVRKENEDASLAGG